MLCMNTWSLLIKKLFKAFPMFAVMQNWEHEEHGLWGICGWLQANYNILDSWSKISHNVNQSFIVNKLLFTSFNDWSHRLRIKHGCIERRTTAGISKWSHLDESVASLSSKAISITQILVKEWCTETKLLEFHSPKLACRLWLTVVLSLSVA